MRDHTPFLDQLRDLEAAVANFDLERTHDYTVANGWHVDAYEAELPPEPPGTPLPNGSFALAKDVLINYEFPDPRIIEGFYQPERDLLNRVMLLKAKFLGFRFYFGVRIAHVIDQINERDGTMFHEWGYSYHTLEGHWEMGEITFKIEKNEETGAVRFLINAYSRTGRIPNVIYRIGFWLFGRRLQITFARRALRRMQRLVADRLNV